MVPMTELVSAEDYKPRVSTPPTTTPLTSPPTLEHDVKPPVATMLPAARFALIPTATTTSGNPTKRKSTSTSLVPSPPPAAPSRKRPSASCSGIRPVERQLMRPWMAQMIDGGEVEGLEWEDAGKTRLRIPWKHGSRQGWKHDTDACLFRHWAQHTGRYKADDPPNPKRWKANFRCAINSLPDVREVKNASQTRGPNAYRVYEFLTERKPRSNNSKGLAKKSGTTVKTEMCSSQKPSTSQTTSTHHTPHGEFKYSHTPTFTGYTSTTTGHASATTGHTSAAISHISTTTGYTSDITGHTSAIASHISTTTGHTSAITGHTSSTSSFTGHISAIADHSSATTGHASATPGHTSATTVNASTTELNSSTTSPSISRERSTYMKTSNASISTSHALITTGHASNATSDTSSTPGPACETALLCLSERRELSSGSCSPSSTHSSDSMCSSGRNSVYHSPTDTARYHKAPYTMPNECLLHCENQGYRPYQHTTHTLVPARNTWHDHASHQRDVTNTQHDVITLPTVTNTQHDVITLPPVFPVSPLSLLSSPAPSMMSPASCSPQIFHTMTSQASFPPQSVTSPRMPQMTLDLAVTAQLDYDSGIGSPSSPGSSNSPSEIDYSYMDDTSDTSSSSDTSVDLLDTDWQEIMETLEPDEGMPFYNSETYRHAGQQQQQEPMAPSRHSLGQPPTHNLPHDNQSTHASNYGDGSTLIPPSLCMEIAYLFTVKRTPNNPYNSTVASSVTAHTVPESETYESHYMT